MDYYFCKGRQMTKEELMVEIFKVLEINGYEDELFISKELRINPSIIHDLILDGIVLYLRENPKVQTWEVCEKLQVSTEYISELVEDDRIVMTRQEVDELTLSRSLIENEVRAQTKQRKKLELARSLQSSMSAGRPSSAQQSEKGKFGYHYRNKNKF